MYIAVNGQTVM